MERQAMSRPVMRQNPGEKNARKSFAREFGDWIRSMAWSRERRDANEGHAAYRKCPACGERDFRISDRQRSRPDVYASRTFRVKWLCLACGERATEIIEEPPSRIGFA
jgi:predicted RNA-binding Zn-ribbon protein involved in translation (DUF1610 family)